MLRLLLPGLVGLGLSGCATIIGPAAAPSCDGYSRRPLNPSMWNWEQAQALPLSSPEVAGDAAGAPAAMAPKLRTGQVQGAMPTAAAGAARFDVAASMNACTAERSHG